MTGFGSRGTPVPPIFECHETTVHADNSEVVIWQRGPLCEGDHYIGLTRKDAEAMARAILGLGAPPPVARPDEIRDLGDVRRAFTQRGFQLDSLGGIFLLSRWGMHKVIGSLEEARSILFGLDAEATPPWEGAR